MDGGELMVGCNFDFYVGDVFVEEKILLFVNFDCGYKFVFYLWVGFIGVVFGMNEKGLFVMINVFKLKVLIVIKIFIVLVVREILQYVFIIVEVVVIVWKCDVFVLELIFVSLVLEKKVGLIEKGLGKIGVYFFFFNILICVNYFQLEMFWNMKENQLNFCELDFCMCY